MINLNLIPEIQKKRLIKERTFYMAHILVGGILIVVAVMALLISISRLVLERHYAQYTRSTSLVNIENQTLVKNVEMFNENIAHARFVQKDHIKWTLLLNDITQRIPPSVEVTFLQVNTQNNFVQFSGISPDREALIATKDALENFPLFSDVDAPLSNLVEKTDIEFKFAATLRQDALEAYRNPALP